ncbi:MAG: hypothetical protein KGJ02_03955 [Verrucomicrobiota bacterium]|nr:hypothetical protein [Verrucomicrobiota bacterium]
MITPTFTITSIDRTHRHFNMRTSDRREWALSSKDFKRLFQTLATTPENPTSLDQLRIFEHVFAIGHPVQVTYDEGGNRYLLTDIEVSAKAQFRCTQIPPPKEASPRIIYVEVPRILVKIPPTDFRRALKITLLTCLVAGIILTV